MKSAKDTEELVEFIQQNKYTNSLYNILNEKDIKPVDKKANIVISEIHRKSVNSAKAQLWVVFTYNKEKCNSRSFQYRIRDKYDLMAICEKLDKELVHHDDETEIYNPFTAPIQKAMSDSRSLRYRADQLRIEATGEDKEFKEKEYQTHDYEEAIKLAKPLYKNTALRDDIKRLIRENSSIFEDISDKVKEKEGKSQLSLIYLNKDRLNEIFERNFTFKSDWYPYYNGETILDIVNAVEKEVNPNFTNISRRSVKKNIPSYRMLGADAEYQSNSNSSLITYQYYDTYFGCGVVQFYRGLKPSFRKSIAYLQRLFKFNKLDFCCHYNIAEISHYYRFSDDLKNIYSYSVKQKDKINKYAPKHHKDKYEYALQAVNNCIVSKRYLTVEPAVIGWDNRQGKTTFKETEKLKIAFKDSYVASNRTSLKDLGKLIGLEKIELETGMIENMADLAQKDPELYMRYAIVDAIISPIFMMRSENFIIHQDLYKKACNNMIPSISSLAGAYVTQSLDDFGIKNLRVFNYSKIHQGWQQTINDGMYNRYKDHVTWTLSDTVVKGTTAYKGGKNECYARGVYTDKIAIDVDIKNAYPSAMLSLYSPDYNSPVFIHDPEKLKDIPEISVGYIILRHFKLKDSVVYPTIPVKTKGSLIFPHSSKCMDTIDLITFLYHYKRGDIEDFKFDYAVYFPPLKYKDHNLNLIGSCIADLIKKREDAKKRGDKFEEKCYKDISNSIYGKTCQGIAEGKKTFDLTRYTMLPDDSYGYNSPKPKSNIYNPVYAASITGLIRCALSEAMEFVQVDNGYQIASATTDGFVILTDEKLSLDFLNNNLPKYCEYIRKCRENYGVDSNGLFDIKHFNEKGDYYFSINTRHYYTLLRKGIDVVPLDKVQVAKGGIQTPYKGDVLATTNFLSEKYFSPDIEVQVKRLTSLFEILNDPEQEFITITTEIKKNYDYDLKRKPIYADEIEVEFNGKTQKNLNFNTIPFESIEEHIRYKKAYKLMGNRKSINKLRDKGSLFELSFIAQNEELISTYFGKYGKRLDLKTIIKYTYIKSIFNQSEVFVYDKKKHKEKLLERLKKEGKVLIDQDELRSFFFPNEDDEEYDRIDYTKRWIFKNIRRYVYEQESDVDKIPINDYVRIVSNITELKELHYKILNKEVPWLKDLSMVDILSSEVRKVDMNILNLLELKYQPGSNFLFRYDDKLIKNDPATKIDQNFEAG